MNKKSGQSRQRYSDNRVQRQSGIVVTMKQMAELPAILIVCEGEKTEPNYFRAFGVTQNIYGEGLETIRVLEEAERKNRELGPFDQVWCVFDRDSFPPDHFDNAIHKAESLGFQVAYSNEAFELWYLLHFEYLDSALSRNQYSDKLSKHLGRSYKKGDVLMYSLLGEHGNESGAIKNARKLQELHVDERSYAHRNPSTTVDKLVMELRKALSRREF